MEWIKYAERPPAIGQRVLITFTGDHNRVQVVYYDDRVSWVDRTEFEWEDYFSDEPSVWFTDADDENDWWDTDACYCWAAIEDPLR